MTQYLKPVTYLVTVILGIYLIIIIWISSIPLNPVTPKFQIKQNINLLFPQGWIFFTKSPRDEMGDLYKVEGQKLVKITLPNGEPSNLFGISRKSRRIGYELSMILGKLNSKHWFTSTEKDIPFDSIKFDTVFATSDINNLAKGVYISKIYKPVPWLYSKGGKTYNNQYRIIGFVLL